MKLAFTVREVTPGSGTAPLKKIPDRLGFDDQSDKLPLPVQGANRSYEKKQLVKQFMTGVWCGTNRFKDCEITRHDGVLKKRRGFKPVAEYKKRENQRLLKLSLVMGPG